MGDSRGGGDTMQQADQAVPPTARQMSSVKAGVLVLATIAGAFALWALRRILEPFVLAIFLLLMVDGLSRELKTRIPRFPDKLATPTSVVFIVAVFASSIWLIANNASDFLGQSASYAQRLNALLERLSDQFGLQTTPTVQELIHKLNPTRYMGKVAEVLKGMGEGAVFVLIYFGFLVASRQGFKSKTGQLFPDQDERKEAERVFDRIRRGVESYMWVQTVVGFIISGLSAVLMFAMGLQHVMFWTFIIFLANYIPAIGAAIGVLFPPVYALVQFPDLWKPIVLLVGLEAIHFGVSHVVQPRMQGKNLNLDPIVVLMALAFWGMMWGVTGAFLSTPLTVMAMAILAEFKGGKPIAIMLSSDGKPYAKEKPGAL